MSDNVAKQIVREALSNNALHKVLLGEPGYCYRPKWSPSSTNTDITVMWEALHDFESEHFSGNLSLIVFEAIHNLLDSYEGIEPTASILLLETIRKNDGRNVFDLPLNNIAQSLKEVIRQNLSKLKYDKRGEGALYQDGLYGDLKRLNRNTVELGGPSFL